ncbi:MAG: nucleotidyltransferase substrate binding protein [Chlamydiae bacterium]|nr:nucleotidyltransferase substrate binding protein [Chlamydiota bacterium]MBI3277497.1 nucleotidyltransferase substrate binding protein [Chlamydiota bacterium]
MESIKQKWREVNKFLKEAIQLYESQPTDLSFLTVAKSFEMVIEYAWRILKRFVEEQGLEAVSPKAAIRESAKLKLISDPEKWMECLEARNNSVHDYFGISQEEYVSLAKDLMELAKELKFKS